MLTYSIFHDNRMLTFLQAGESLLNFLSYKLVIVYQLPSMWTPSEEVDTIYIDLRKLRITKCQASHSCPVNHRIICNTEIVSEVDTQDHSNTEEIKSSIKG